ncbi:MAG: ferritin-like domain-containing protein [Nannocystaceae bacterium]
MDSATLLRFRASILLSLGLGLTTACAGDDKASTGETTSGSGSTTTDTSGSSGATSASSTSDGSGSESASGSGTSGSGTSGSTSGSTGETSGGVQCEGSTPIDQADVDPATPSGFELCPDGGIHRVEAVECKSPATPDSCTDNSGGGCTSAADCTEFPHGSCQQDQDFGGVLGATTCSCVYGCATDSDCADGEVCRCAGTGLGLYTECIAGGCVDDSDCGDYLCGLSPDTCEPGGFATVCHGPDDLCYDDADCPDFFPCSYAPNGGAVWECNGAVCGRPFLIAEVAQLAPVGDAPAGCDWAGELRPAVDHLAAPLRERLAAHWSAIAAMEHASVASFARAILELMAVGAPAELLTATQAALAEEIEHARRTFALASAYAGRELGPGPLAIDGALVAAQTGAQARRRLAEAVAREACVAETVAAVEARAAAERARDPRVRRVLAEIADEEEAHSALGWRTLAWLLEGLDLTSRAEVYAVLDQAIEAAAADSAEGPEDEVLEPFGVLSRAHRRDAVRCALREIVRPCARSLSCARAA